MIDKTTDGYSATTDEIEGMLRNLCAYALSEPDPLQRYIDLTHQQVLFDGVVAAIRRERGKALADLAVIGVPVEKIAEMTRLDTPQRVKSLVTAAGVTMPKPRKAGAKKAGKGEPDAPGARGTSRPQITGTGDTRAGVPVLPATVVPAGKRVLTAEERRLLGIDAGPALSRR